MWVLVGSECDEWPDRNSKIVLFHPSFPYYEQTSNHLNWLFKHGNTVEAAVSSPAPLCMRTFFTLPVGIGASFSNGLTKHLLAAATTELAIAGFLRNRWKLQLQNITSTYDKIPRDFGVFPRRISKQSMPKSFYANKIQQGPKLPMSSTCLAHAPWWETHLPSSDPHLLVGQRFVGQGSRPQSLRLASQAVAAAQGVGSVAHVLRLPRHHRAIVCHGATSTHHWTIAHGKLLTEDERMRSDSGIWQSANLEILLDESAKLWG